MKLKKIINRLDFISNIKIYCDNELLYDGSIIPLQAGAAKDIQYIKDCLDDGDMDSVYDICNNLSLLDYKLDGEQCIEYDNDGFVIFVKEKK